MQEREGRIIRVKSLRSPEGIGPRAQVKGLVLDQLILCSSKEGRVHVCN